MRNQNPYRTRAKSAHSFAVAVTLAVTLAALLVFARGAGAASWNNIEPLKSRRADVERILGKPVQDQPGETGTLQFRVVGGTVTVAFVTAKFIAAKKLQPELEGTVLQIILKHDRSADTPESLGLAKKSDFAREDGKNGVAVYRNLKDGIIYTFVGGQLKTTRYSPPSEQLARVQVKG